MNPKVLYCVQNYWNSECCWPAGWGWSNQQACFSERDSALTFSCSCHHTWAPGSRWDAWANAEGFSLTFELDQMALLLNKHENENGRGKVKNVE